MSNTSQPQVILVDEQDREIGCAEKILAHRHAQLHRAFSVFIFRQQPSGYELLLQQRNPQKYHSGGLWTNTCCSHPTPGETVLAAAQRRLYEEMGIEAELQEVGRFHYIAQVGNELVENEMDHVLVGLVEQQIKIQPNHAEAVGYRWIDLPTLQHELQANPECYTAWFAEALQYALTKIPMLC